MSSPLLVPRTILVFIIRIQKILQVDVKPSRANWTTDAHAGAILDIPDLTQTTWLHEGAVAWEATREVPRECGTMTSWTREPAADSQPASFSGRIITVKWLDAQNINSLWNEELVHKMLQDVSRPPALGRTVPHATSFHLC